MTIKKFSNYYILRLHKGEEIISALKEAVRVKRIKGAFFYGLGVGQDLVLGYFEAKRKVYIKKAFEGEYEFTSLIGNISRMKSEIVVHCHVTITDKSFNAFGGHLFQGVIPATCEIIILPFKKVLRRKKDKKTGLNLLAV
jgi:hypothetical protein